MKKSLIALAVAGALTAPMVAQADATLYGSLRIKMVNNDDAGFDVQDNSSRIGIRGSNDLFSGAKAIFQFEQAVSTDDGAWAGGRLANLGITGDFGTAIFGRIWTPYYNWTGAQTDVSDSAVSASSTYVVGVHRASDVIAYITPDMNGFQAAVATITSETGTKGDGNDDGENVDGFHAAAKYSANGLHLGLSYLSFEDTLQPALLDKNTPVSYDDVISAAASYTMGDFYVAARYEDRDRVGAASDQDAWELATTYTMGNTKLIASFIDDDQNEDDQWVLEVQQRLGEQARVFASVVDYGNDAEDTGFEVGYRVDF